MNCPRYVNPAGIGPGRLFAGVIAWASLRRRARLTARPAGPTREKRNVGTAANAAPSRPRPR